MTDASPASILPLDTAEATLAAVGGKGLNLARLARAGFPVPGGFLVSTDAYRAFVAANALQAGIAQALEGLAADDPAALQAASAEIRGRFAAGTLPTDLAEALTSAYLELGSPPVAVRSSATAEDLPDMSFAGQQDTFLNVIGVQALQQAVVDCWSSLWTARAIGYRARNGIGHEEAALAVVVQEMVQSEASGVLFTANPLNGKRTETVIDATLGLGEALVAGLVEPDHFVVDSESGRVLAKSVGQKSLVIASKLGGGTQSTEGRAQREWSIPDEVVLELVQLGRRVAEHYDGEPQDIEWAWADERLFLLQSRPITSLFPVPEGLGPDPLRVMFAFSAVQGVMEPISPLGRDVVSSFLLGIACLFQPQTTLANQGMILTAGERLWLDFTSLFRHERGRKVIMGGFGFIEPGTRRALESLVADPRLAILPRRMRWRTRLRLLRLTLVLIGRLIYTMRKPETARDTVLALIEQREAETGVCFEATDSLTEQVEAIREIWTEVPIEVFPILLPRFAAGMVSFNLLNKLTQELPDNEQQVLEITRGLPHNVTTEMDLALWATAQRLQADAAALAAFEGEEASTLAEKYQQGELPPKAQAAVAEFMTRYGMRGVGEIDMGRPRWREQPQPIMQMLQNYLRIDDPEQAPDVVFARGAETAEAKIEELAAALRTRRGGWIKARLVRAAGRRMRALMGLRETPKFLIIRFMGHARRAFLRSGEQLTEAGILQDPTDVLFLHLSELLDLDAGVQRDWQALVAARRAANARELRRKQIPRLLLSDGAAFYEGVASAADERAGVISGSPVSPGVVEGAVRVVFEPHDAHLQPGEILVCPGTDPSWTPLFLAAGGLIMEVGGMMTHGSVVAREYGIPAVVGVSHATARLQTGQRVRVNGSTGEITIIEKT